MSTTVLINSHSLLDDEREMAALAPARLAFGRLSAIIETTGWRVYRGGTGLVGGWSRMYMRRNCTGGLLYMRHNCVVVSDSLKCAYAHHRPD